MTGDQLVGLIASGLMLVLVASGLVARRLDWSQTARMALAWAAIFLGAVALLKVLGFT